MQVTIRNKSVCIDGRPIPLISGEVHYWRLDPEHWEKILEQVKALGLEIVSTYVPWEFHEISLREYDFTGKTNPRRNLKKYLELLDHMGFWVIIRPGPYIYSEWKNLGIPDRVVHLERSSVEFVKEARHYLESVSEIVRPHFATNGGRIILAQSDNELDPFIYSYEKELGILGGEGSFQIFLKNRYHQIRDLNEAWKSSYKKFSEARPICDFVGNDSRHWRRFLDYKEFIHAHVEEMGKRWCEEYTQAGYDIPLYLNLYGFYEIQPWKALAKASNFSALDLYPAQEFNGELEEHRDFLEKIRALKVSSPVPFIAEFQSGTWHGYHTQSGLLSPNHYRMSAISALLSGATGWNWYMLVNRDNWYLCPIDEKGEIRHEIYNVFKEIVSVFKMISPHELKRVGDMGATFYPLHEVSRSISRENAVLKALYEADVDYEFVDIEEKVSHPKLIFYSGASWLPRREQNNLLNYVREGGTLVSFLEYPHLDENLQPLNLLKFQEPCSILGEKDGIGCVKFLEFKLKNNHLQLKGPFYLFDTPGGNVFFAQGIKIKNRVGQWCLPNKYQYPIGYCRKEGKGRILHLGVNPTPELLLEVLKYLNVEPFCRSLTSGVLTAAYERKNRLFIFVVNTGNESKSADIEFSRGQFEKSQAADLFSGHRVPLFYFENKWRLDISLERKSGTVISVTRYR